MSQMDPYERGVRDGIRWASTWLSHRAAAMNDEHAKLVLNSAATNMGWERTRLPKRLPPPGVAISSVKP